MLAGLLAAAPGALESARDRQDRAALEKLAGEFAAAARRPRRTPSAVPGRAGRLVPGGGGARTARQGGRRSDAAEAGVKAAERAIALKPDNAEYHRVLGTLCGQAVPGNVLAGLSYGKRAQDAIDKALEMDPKSAAPVCGARRGQLLPAAGLRRRHRDLAIADFRKAIELDAASGRSVPVAGPRPAQGEQ